MSKPLSLRQEQVLQATVHHYVDTMEPVGSRTLVQRFGIPASIVLANGLLHTLAGTSVSAQTANNYFALPCGNDWTGERKTIGGACARTYDTAWLSFRDHSLYITTGRFQPMTQFSRTDYAKWAAGLQELGFNGTTDLATQLVRTIERYGLGRFD